MSQMQPTIPHHPVDVDQEHLRLLWTYHTLIAGLLFFFWLFFTVFPLLIGPTYFSTFHWAPPAQGLVLRQLLLASLVSNAIQILILGLNAWTLKQQKGWFSAVMLSSIECLCVFPLGPILGISAILVLRRPSVKALFEQKH